MEKEILQDKGQIQEVKKDIQVYAVASNLIKDKEGVQIYRRSEKICKAYFLLTQHIQDGENIKQKLRNSGLDLSLKTLDLISTFNKTEEIVRGVATCAMSLVSVSDIAVASRLISDSNYRLVVQQVQLFMEEVEKYWRTTFDNNQVIPVTLFDVESLDSSYKAVDTDDMSFIQSVQFGSTTPVSVVPTPVSTRSPNHTSVSGGTPTLHTIKTPVKAKSSVHKNSDTGMHTAGDTYSSAISQTASKDTKNDRQLLILNTISSRGESSIKDLTDVIKGCSEKTIQRELISLVQSGDLSKTGERRWSRYSISKPL